MRQNEYIDNLLPFVKDVYPMACRLLGDSAKAEDVIQDVMYSLWDKRKELSINTSYRAFLYQAVKNRCLDELRKRKKTFEQYEENNEPIAPPNEDFDTMEWIRHCINQLPKQQKQIVYMREVDGLAYHEIASLLQLNEPNVRMTLSRAKKELQKMIKKGI